MAPVQTFDYVAAYRRALEGVVRSALTLFAQRRLADQHRFLITFSTKAPDVSLSPSLLAQYPEEMSVSLNRGNHVDLAVEELGFSVVLSFNTRNQGLYVPFAAIRQFVDTGMNIMLDLGEAQVPSLMVLEDADAPKAEPPKVAAPPPPDPSAGGANVVSVDFKKR